MTAAEWVTDYSAPTYNEADWQADRLATFAATLTPTTEHTRKVNDGAREVPDWLQTKAEMGRDY